MSDIAAERVFRRVEGVVQRDVAGETFLVPIRGHLADLQELFVLNEAGRWLWGHLDGWCSLDDLVAGLVAEFEVDEESARRDARVFIEQLTEAGLAEYSLPVGV
jgi:hypothetical protein